MTEEARGKAPKHPPTERAVATGRGAVPTKGRGVATKGRASHTGGVVVPTKRSTATGGRKALDGDKAIHVLRSASLHAGKNI